MLKKFQRVFKPVPAAIVLIALVQCLPLPLNASTVYVYRNSHGSVLITDQPRSTTGYSLVSRRTYGTARKSNDFSKLRPIISLFDPLIHQIALLQKMDRSLIKAVIHAESAFNPDAVSSKGAVGLMQLMPNTARSYGVLDRNDPAQNVAAGSRHLKDLLKRYADTSLALAAYNAGIKSVDRFGGIPPYPETENYVKKVLILHELYRGRESG